METVESALKAWRDPRDDETTSSLDTAVEIHGTEHGFERVGEDGILVTAPGRSLTTTEIDVVSEADRTSHIGECPLVDDRLAEIGERSLGAIRVSVVGEVGDHPTEYRVAEELEALIALGRLVLGHPGAVAQRATEQAEVIEAMPEGLLEGG